MGTFRLMRKVTETPDPVTDALAKVLSDRRVRKGESFTELMDFWNMKQRGELAETEPAATWIVLMRWVDAPTAVSLVMKHCTDSWIEPAMAAKPLRDLWGLREVYKSPGPYIAATFVRKLRTKFVAALHRVVRGPSALGVLDPGDAHLLLSAVEASLLAKEEDDRRWATTRPR